MAIPAISAQYSMFQAAPPAKMMEDGKIHTVEHIINPIAVQQDPASAAAAAAAAAAAVIPAVSTPPPFQVSSALKSCFPYIPLPICPTSQPSCFSYVLLCIPSVGEEPGLLPCFRSRDECYSAKQPCSSSDLSYTSVLWTTALPTMGDPNLEGREEPLMMA